MNTLSEVQTLLSLSSYCMWFPFSAMPCSPKWWLEIQQSHLPWKHLEEKTGQSKANPSQNLQTKPPSIWIPFPFLSTLSASRPSNNLGTGQGLGFIHMWLKEYSGGTEVLGHWRMMGKMVIGWVTSISDNRVVTDVFLLKTSHVYQLGHIRLIAHRLWA